MHLLRFRFPATFCPSLFAYQQTRPVSHYSYKYALTACPCDDISSAKRNYFMDELPRSTFLSAEVIAARLGQATSKWNEADPDTRQVWTESGSKKRPPLNGFAYFAMQQILKPPYETVSEAPLHTESSPGPALIHITSAQARSLHNLLTLFRYQNKKVSPSGKAQLATIAIEWHDTLLTIIIDPPRSYISATN